VATSGLPSPFKFPDRHAAFVYGVTRGLLKSAVPLAHQDDDIGVETHQIQNAIAIEIRLYESAEVATARVALFLKSPVAVAQHHLASRSRHVQYPVPVEVPYGRRQQIRSVAGRTYRRLECAVAIAGQNAEITGAVAVACPHRAHVRYAVTVEIGDHRRPDTPAAQRPEYGRLKGTIAISKQHRDIAGEVAHRQV
jgi:uncharacterized iron-regulated membrane protein